MTLGTAGNGRHFLLAPILSSLFYNQPELLRFYYLHYPNALNKTDLIEEQHTRTHSGSIATKLLLILFLGILLGVEGYFGYRLHQLSDQQKEIKRDYAD